MEVEVSIIVPVYNEEKYIKRCINSIMLQQLDSFEIVIVDDCSTDGTCLIVEELAQKHKQIVFFRNDRNYGAGYTKNRALSLCRGKYVCFVDSDDFLFGNSLNQVYKLAEKEGTDDIFYQSKLIDEEKVSLENSTDNDCTDIIIENIFEAGIGYLEEMITRRKLTVSAWHHFFKREVLTPEIRFYENSINDDFAFAILLLLRVGKTAIVKNEMYVYMQRKKGNITSVAKTRSLVMETYIHAIELRKILVSKCIKGDLADELFIYMLVILLNDYYKKREICESEYREVLELINRDNVKNLFDKAEKQSQYGIVNPQKLKQLSNYSKVYIYGSGNYGIDLYRILDQSGIRVEAFLETNPVKNIKYNVPVFKFSESEFNENSAVIVAVSERYREEVLQAVDDIGKAVLVDIFD